MIRVITAAATDPVSLSEVKEQIRGLDKSTGEDLYVQGLITTVTDLVEVYLGRAIMPQTWEIVLDAVPDSQVLEFPKAPLASITSVTTIDVSEVSTVFAASNYVVDTYSSPGRIVLKTGVVWPSTTLRVVNGFVVRFVAGYASKAVVPQAIKTAIVRAVDALYSNRKTKAVTKSGLGMQTQQTRITLSDDVKSILAPYKIFQV